MEHSNSILPSNHHLASIDSSSGSDASLSFPAFGNSASLVNFSGMNILKSPRMYARDQVAFAYLGSAYDS